MAAIMWMRDGDNPILPVIAGTWRHSRVANCSLLIRGDTAYLYYRAGVGVWWQGYLGHEAIGLATCPLRDFDGKTWQDCPYNPIFTHGAPDDFDGVGPIDPFVIEHEGTIYLFYVGTANPPLESLPADGVFHRAPVWIKRPGLATSRDGLNFRRVQTTPLIGDDPALLSLCCIGRRGGRWEALGIREMEPGADYYQRRYAYYHYTAQEVTKWTLTRDEPVLLPGPDSRSLSNCRRLQEGGWTYLVYGGTPQRDYPDHFGLARSRDLIHWQKHPDPVFQRGEPGQWDDGGIWVGDLARVGDTYYLWYEGRSAGIDRNREYAPGGFSQIGLATLGADDFTRLIHDFDRM